MSTQFVDPKNVRALRAGVDFRGLEQALRQAIEGEVRFDDGSRALYATDASNYRQVPIGVVIPRTIEDVVRTVAACREFGAPVLPPEQAAGASRKYAGSRSEEEWIRRRD